MLNVFKNIKFPVKKIRKPKFLNMGCICSKETKDEDKVKEKKEKKNSSKKLEASVKKEEVVVEVDDGGNDAIIEQKEKSVRKGGDKKSFDNQPEQICRVLSVRNGVDPSQVVAGWPSWLTAVAGEAIKGWIPRSGESFEKLEKIGQGTYSSVYRARDLETGKIVALKKVRFMNMDPESVQFMAREILILRRLDHPNVMKLEGLVTSRVSGNFYLVFEYMEHDLAGLSTSPTVKLTEPQIKCYMQQLFRGLEHCHNRGVLHRDIKGSNLLIDNNGNLKIGDFGLATFFRANQKQALTSRVVTLWYRPPELLLGATNYGVAVDMWSSGCILAELFAGKPIMPGRTEVEQLHKIFKLCGSPSDEYWTKSKLPHATIFKPQQPYKRTVAETFKNFPSSALSLLESLIAFEPELRGSATSALQSEFFTTKPLPCDPSSFPKFPPSKEFDTKMREEEARKQKAAGGKGQESSKKGSKASKAAAAHDTNAELQLSVQKRKGKSNLKSSSSEVGFQIEPSRGYNGHGMQKKNPLLHIVDQGSHLDSHISYNSSGFKEFKTQRSFKPQSTQAQLSRFSNSVASNNSSQLDFSRNNHSHWQEHSSNLDAESSHVNNVQLPQKDRGVYALKKTRMHYSGPLFPPSESVEDMLKEHEKRIQIAVRKARADKNKPKDEYAYRQTDSLLECQ